MGALVELDPRMIAATPGQPTIAQLRVRNSGSVVDQFDLTVLGEAAVWTTIDPPTLSLFPGAEATATLTFTPPRSPSVRAGSVAFGVRAASREDPSGSAVDEGSVEVAAFSDVFVELVPQTSRGSTGATHDVAIDNRGNVPLNATLSAEDADRLLAFEMRPPAVVAEPGTAAFAKLRVRPKRTFWRGPSMRRPFNVQVAVPDAQPVTAQGSLLQTAILPPWLLPALAALVAVLVIAAVAWTTLLRPAIESTAKQQAQDVLAAVGITPPPSGGAGGGGSASASPGSSGSPGASASPSSSATPAPTPTNPPVAGGATPVDGRLVPGGALLSPPSGVSLYLTDLVFSNPSATSTGDIRLERSGQPLLVLRLEDFRDLDFHFVTPIVVAAGQKVALVCPGPCPGAAVFYTGYQR